MFGPITGSTMPYEQCVSITDHCTNQAIEYANIAPKGSSLQNKYYGIAQEFQNIKNDQCLQIAIAQNERCADKANIARLDAEKSLRGTSQKLYKLY